MPVKLLTSGGGGVNLVPSSSIASDQTMYLPTSGTSGGTVLCTDSTGGTANGVLYLNSSKQVTSGSGLVFDSSGNLLVGTTSQQNGGKTCVDFTGGRGMSIRYTAGSSGVGMIVFGNTNGNIGEIVVNGNTCSYNNYSDYRLKENIAPMTGALEKVAQLKPCTYKWNADGSDGEGFIAHELQAVCPQAVTGEKDEVDSEGNPKYQGIDQSKIVPLLTAALQEAVAKIESQAQTIESLTQRIEALEYTKQGE